VIRLSLGLPPTSASPPTTQGRNPLRGYTSASPPTTQGWNPLRGYLPCVQIPFTSSPRSSLGVEWELELVDLQTRELSGAASDILAEISGPHGGEHPKAKHELLESCIEVITGVCGTVEEALDDLRTTVDEVSAAAAKRGIGLMCSGTHPFTDWATQQISPNPRYAKLIEDMQWLARRLQIFGVHVHVGVRSPDKAIPIVNALTAYIPHFLALSASSPYWMGTDTGLSSARSKVFEGLPTAGLPYQLSGWNDFENFMETLISAQTISTIREVWWDVRPHPQFGTVELRICDGLPSLFEIGWAAALSQCLVEMFNSQIDKGYTLPTPKGWTVRENKWRAARYGIDAQILVDDQGRTAPLRDSVSALVEELAPFAERLGCSKELARAQEMLDIGPSAQRQRAVAAAKDGDLTAVVDSLLGEMRSGAPGGAGEA
jgi:glutamate---cysteine ligase / carboxylate-amine ligase